MPRFTLSQLKAQLKKLKATGFDKLLASAAQKHGLEVPFLYAIASRESACSNVLGDVRGGEAHGVGILQIDVQHPIARNARDTGTWKTSPGKLIDFGAALLASNLKSVRILRPAMTDLQHHKLSASAYNAGLGSALYGSDKGDSDLLTTSHDYGKDILARMAAFQKLLAG